MLKGYSTPLSPLGRANLVPAPPWHYAGQLLVIDYWADPDAVRAHLPPGLLPGADPGACAALFVEWQACTDGGDELLDPVRAQYREFFVLCSATFEGTPVLTCPYIFVDQDVSMLRGLIQGYPKVLGSVHITRSLDLPGRAAARLEAGSVFAGTLAVKDRRLAEGKVTLEHESPSGPTHMQAPIVNLRHFPRLTAGEHDRPAVLELVRMNWRDQHIGRCWTGEAHLEFFDAPNQELSALRPQRLGKGFRYDMAITINDAEQLRDLRVSG